MFLIRSSKRIDEHLGINIDHLNKNRMYIGFTILFGISDIHVDGISVCYKRSLYPFGTSF